MPYERAMGHWPSSLCSASLTFTQRDAESEGMKGTEGVGDAGGRGTVDDEERKIQSFANTKGPSLRTHKQTVKPDDLGPAGGPPKKQLTILLSALWLPWQLGPGAARKRSWGPAWRPSLSAKCHPINTKWAEKSLMLRAFVSLFLIS